MEPQDDEQPQPGLLGGISRVIVTLMWGALIVMLVVVAVLAHRFYS